MKVIFKTDAAFEHDLFAFNGGISTDEKFRFNNFVLFD